jgi:hypothetical protein
MVLVLPCAAAAVSAQSPQDGVETPARPIVSDATLARIRKALESEPVLTVDQDALRFYVQISATRMTFADYLKGAGAWFEITGVSAPTRITGGARVPPAGGIDLGALFGRANRAVQDRKARQIRERIEQELRALEAARASRTEP